MRAMLIGVLALVGCGGEPPQMPETADGTWALDDGDGCRVALFISGATYEKQTVCKVAGGGHGADVEVGGVAITPDTMVFKPTQASCPDAAHTTWHWNYNFSGGDLVVFSAGGLGTFKRIPPESAAVEFGCLYEDGSFAPGPIEKL